MESSNAAVNTAGKQRGRPFEPGKSGNPNARRVPGRSIARRSTGRLQPICYRFFSDASAAVWLPATTFLAILATIKRLCCGTASAKRAAAALLRRTPG